MKKECSNKLDDIFIIVNNKDLEFAVKEDWRYRNLVFAKKRQKVLAPDSSMATWSPVGRKQILVDPVITDRGFT